MGIVEVVNELIELKPPEINFKAVEVHNTYYELTMNNQYNGGDYNGSRQD